MAGERDQDVGIVAALGRRLASANATTLNNFAWFAARHGEHAAALDAARRAVSMPDAPHAALRALERLAAGRTDGILLAADDAAPAGRRPAGSPLAAAVAAHRQMEAVMAEACYRAAIDDPRLAAAAWNGLAVLHEHRHERVAADAAWGRALASGSVAAAHNRALAMLRRGLPHRARAALAPWLERTPVPAVLHFLAGYAALADQDPGSALPLLAAAAASDPDSARAQFTLGLAFERTGRHDDALAAIRRALLLSPWYLPQVWLLERDATGTLVELPADSVDSDPGLHTDDVLLTLGRSLLQTAHLGEALAVFDQVLAHQPSQPAALFHRGVVLAKLRRYDEAFDDWETVGRVDPGTEIGSASRRHARSARQLASLFAGG
ncbi:MAG TPA: tetratricopeptide repeat protein [Gemmatimonadales bacterium]